MVVVNAFIRRLESSATGTPSNMMKNTLAKSNLDSNFTIIYRSMIRGQCLLCANS